MKKIILLAAIAAIFSTNLQAQTTVKLKFNQKLETGAFTFNTQKASNLGENYTIKRLQYYVSQVVLVHDNGLLDTFKGKYLLIDPSKDTATITLGDLTFTNIEAIQFSIGVDNATNHKDPSLYSANDPLSPKSPSMHWGWASGYRFLAIEGKCGNSMNLNYELHGLGDGNYFSIRIPVTAADDNGAKLITLNADYSQVLKSISVKNGVIAHGEDAEDLKALQNMRDLVFTSTTGQGNVLKTNKVVPVSQLLLYPNPVRANEKISLDQGDNLTYNIYNICGSLVQTIATGTAAFKIMEAGIYQIIATNNFGITVASGKLIVQ